MNDPSVASPEVEDDCVSRCSMSIFDDIARKDAAVLKQAFMLITGAMKAKEEELSRLREEKDEAMGSEGYSMAEIRGLKKELQRATNMLVIAQREKEKAMEEVKACKREIGTLKGEMKAQKQELNRLREEEEIDGASYDSDVDYDENDSLGEESTSKKGGNEETETVEVTRKRKAEVDSKLEMVIKGTRSQESLNVNGNDRLLASVWKSSRSKVVSFSNCSHSIYRSGGCFHDALNCAPLKSGKFEWKIRINQTGETKSKFLLLGVIFSSLDVSSNGSFGRVSKKCRGIDFEGNIWERRKFDNDDCGLRCPSFDTGSVVHFVLNMTEKGTLSYSVDESSFHEIYTNMKRSLFENEGFLPATAMVGKEITIELLDFKDISSK